jgi:serine/threonine protein kinase/formylglycine-generating enzyme required for sulfatase activity
VPDETPGNALDVTLRDFTSGQKVFARYTLIRVLGRGGMGIVWLAHDELLDRDVALKFLPEVIVHDRAVLEDLKRETKRNLELTHENIIRIHDFVHNVVSGCISMEYVEGDTISNLRADRPTKIFEPDEIKPWLRQLCEALDYAHNRARVIHRDLKPSNLMINRRGEVKIADFGIARSLSDSVSMLTHARGTSGTLVYMSPQQLDGEPGTHLDDIYSLGATIYELLTSRPPFYSGNIDRQIHEKIASSMTQRRRDLDVEGNSIPREWEETVAACLSKDPALRPQSAMEVAWRLGLVKVYAPEGTPAPPSATEDVTKSQFDTDEQLKNARVKEHRLKIAIVAGVIMLAVTGGSVVWYFGVYEPASARKASEERAAAQRRESEAKAQQQRREASESVTEGQLLLKAGKLDEAVARARDALAKVASYPDAEALVDSVTEARQKAIAAQATKEHPYENSLGMKFVAVPQTGVLFSIWETRVKDFAAFVEGSGHQATGGMGSLGEKGWDRTGKTWKDPGFEQTGEHPVCGVSWEDATAFCEWLTKEERKSGRISTEQVYRLPSDLEWSAAVGLEKESGSTPKERYPKVSDVEVYPWGSGWPPPSGAGNYAGSEARTGSWPPKWETIKGYRDNYPRTSPVGSFAANKYGIYDMGGNVWEWCQDWWEEQHYNRVIRGASWKTFDPVRSLSRYRAVYAPWVRADDTGFRCVLAVVSSR